MNITRTGFACAVAALVATALSGCSETGFQDAMGAGKWSPDSSQVNSNHALSMPPDLQLRPPGQQPPPPQPGGYQNQAFIPQQPQPGQYQPNNVAAAPPQQPQPYGAASIPVYQAPGDHTASTSPAPGAPGAPAAQNQAQPSATPEQYQSAALAPPPATTPQPYQPAQAAPAPAPGATAAPQSITPGGQQVATAPAAPPQDIYARYGISRVRADGSKKTEAELRNELKQKSAEAKKQQNPSYGTIWNLGSIWSDD